MIEGQIANDDDLAHHGLEDEFAREFGPGAAATRSRSGTSKSRRDSVAPFAGLTGRLKALLTEGSEEGEEDDVKARLEAVEKSTLRIERMLERLCEELDDGMKRSSNSEEGETGTMQDLDESGISDIDV